MGRASSKTPAALALVIMFAAGPAEAAQYPAIYAFGDSLTDAGNVWTVTLRTEPLSPPYSSGRFSNGPVWVQYLGQSLGVGSLKPSLEGGTDFAYGGAETGPTSVHGVSPLDLPAQLAQFAANVPHPRSGALYVLWIGANDLFDILSQPRTLTQVATALNDIVRNEDLFVSAIALSGARNLMVVTAPDLGATPFIRAQGAEEIAAGTAVSKQFNLLLVEDMRFLAVHYGLTLTVVDSLALIDSAIANPASYGFTDVTDPCWTGGFTSTSGSLCARGVTVQNQHLFWDHMHPTTRAHGFIASAAETALAVRPATVADVRVSAR
jgi:phospholipase/lecithinase/hemolysin